jgi:hypothetical protein
VHEGLAARDLLRGRRLRVEGESARAIGVDRLGRLEIEVAGERRLVESGEVLLED